MLVVIGGCASGKRTYVKSLGYEDDVMADGVLDGRPVLLSLQDVVAHDERSPEELANCLVDKQVVCCREVGNGIVPLDPQERAWRERVGRTLNIVAERADSVVRMVCGIPVVLK